MLHQIGWCSGLCRDLYCRGTESESRSLYYFQFFVVFFRLSRLHFEKLLRWNKRQPRPFKPLRTCVLFLYPRPIRRHVNPKVVFVFALFDYVPCKCYCIGCLASFLSMYICTLRVRGEWNSGSGRRQSFCLSANRIHIRNTWRISAKFGCGARHQTTFRKLCGEFNYFTWRSNGRFYQISYKRFILQ